jgi:hypothetical protein
VYLIVEAKLDIAARSCLSSWASQPWTMDSFEGVVCQTWQLEAVAMAVLSPVLQSH